MTFAIIYIVGAALTGGVVHALMDRDSLWERSDAIVGGGLAAFMWPVVLAFGGFALLAAVGYRFVKGYVDTAADAYDDLKDLTRHDEPLREEHP